MTERDWNNLEFLLYASEQAICEWYEQATEDDKQYAITLLELAKLEFIDHEVALDNDCQQARAVLTAIRQK
jgi:hypothetical protein